MSPDLCPIWHYTNLYSLFPIPTHCSCFQAETATNQYQHSRLLYFTFIFCIFTIYIFFCSCICHFVNIKRFYYILTEQSNKVQQESCFPADDTSDICAVTSYSLPRAGSGVVRIDPLRFLAGCRTRRLNQV